MAEAGGFSPPSSEMPVAPAAGAGSGPPSAWASSPGENPGTVPLEKKLSLRGDGGEAIDIQALRLPGPVQDLLMNLDMDNSGEVSAENLRDTLAVMQQLKKGLDVDGSGSVTHKEMQDGVQLLSDLMKGQKNNSAEMAYKHLPPCIQDVMQEWDADGSGHVGAGELAAAAAAYKKSQQEGRMMKKIICGLAVVILILMCSVFVLSYLAVEMAKEMRGSDDGTMATPTGAVVKVASSDFELAADGSMIIRGTVGTNATCPGGTCRRLGSAGGSSALKVASAESSRRLSSTLPDTTFKELKSLTLKDTSDHTLKITITSFQRLKLRTSKCGSVVHLNSPDGRITLDDYEMTADDKMQEYVKEAGMGALFENLAGSFGRRLSATDGMLEGFFNLLDDIEWQCESVELPSPEDMPQFYHAKIRVKHMHETPDTAHSYLFTDGTGHALDVAGVVEGADGKVYKTWEEDLIKSGSITAYMSQYAMRPFSKEVRVKRAGMELKMDVENGVGYRCLVQDAGATTMGAVTNAETESAPTMEFVGVVVEDGTVLRHWRMDTMPEPEGGFDDEDQAAAMVKAGMIPNKVDYFDVDTDPSGKFESGQPYRIRMYSDLPGSRVSTEKQYLSITELPVAYEMRGVLDSFGVSKVDTHCVTHEKVRGNATSEELADDASYLEATMRSDIDPFFSLPPPINPWSEMVNSVRYTYDKLVKASQSAPDSEEYRYAMKYEYWNDLLKVKANRDEIERGRQHVFVPDDLEAFLEDKHMDDPSAYNLTNGTNGTRRLRRRLQSSSGGRRLGVRTPGETDDHYHVLIEPHHYRERKGHLRPSAHARALAARRLDDDDDKPGWKFEVWVTPEYIDISIDIGKVSMEFVVNYCNINNPTNTNWGACQTGRFGAGDIVKLEAYANGEQTVWPWPTTKLNVGGLLVYDDTGGIGCQDTLKVFLQSEGARGKVLESRSGSFGLHNDKGGWQKWQLVSAKSHGLAGTQLDVRIQDHRGMYIQSHSNGQAKFTWNAGGWEKWRILGAGSGMVYFRSHRDWNKYLGVRETGPQPPALQCTVTLYERSDCSTSRRRAKTWSKTTTKTSGEEFRPGNEGRRRRRRNHDDWESAKLSKDCSLVEFFDEDDDTSGYEDNVLESPDSDGGEKCINFPSDLEEDCSGFKAWAKGFAPPDFVGDVVLVDGRNEMSKWRVFDECDCSHEDCKPCNGQGFGDAGCNFGEATLYGGLTFSKSIEIIFGIEAEFTTEIAAGAGFHNVHGSYLKEVYGKGILQISFVQMWLLLTFSPNDPWYNDYKEWTMCAKVGYEVDTWMYTYRDDMEIFCSDLSF
eukprot:TRINITY_DN90342_c0_g1_i1.p1 TRINITY_DN90342_c0_g1~~TRINITY_DN90342_c0_g1_i1.p1  ORF type:complete len:1316 (+),score=338.31 TRINITY_DN90342_c0_g1_i1:96-4043(+)